MPSVERPRPPRAGWATSRFERMLRSMSSAATPTHIGPYELIARLGAGGMAETFVAMRRGPGAFAQRVCLKRLRPELERDPDFVRQFMAEAAIAARLRHAAIAQVLDFGQHGPHYYLALELVDGCDLRELLQAAGGALPPALVLYVAVELATALDFAHRAGGAHGSAAVVHRDVSPSNTLVSTEGEVKLTDFGIARAVGDPKHTRTGIVKGKAPYMAPEYARSARLDPRSDLFSLGVLLYECACGARPHDGATDLETLERASRGARTPLAERVPALAAGLVAIIECLLEPDPELRYQSAADVLEALLTLRPSPRARLELGALVSQALQARRPGQDARAATIGPPTEVIEEPEGAAAGTTSSRREPPRTAATTAAADAAGSAAESAPRRTFSSPSRGARVALALAALSVACVIGVALLRTRSASTAAPRTTRVGPVAARAAAGPRAATPEPILSRPEPRAEVVARGATAAAAAAGPGSGTASQPVPPRAAQTASLEVIVLPYGEQVSIDGEYVGKAPVEVGLAPGEHTIEANNGSLTLKRRVSLVAGQRKQVVLR